MSDEVYCPFDSRGVCPGDCPTNHDRICINGEPVIRPADSNDERSSGVQVAPEDPWCRICGDHHPIDGPCAPAKGPGPQGLIASVAGSDPYGFLSAAGAEGYPDEGPNPLIKTPVTLRRTGSADASPDGGTPRADPLARPARDATVYPCCDHCPEREPEGHAAPCRHGCDLVNRPGSSDA